MKEYIVYLLHTYEVFSDNFRQISIYVRKLAISYPCFQRHDCRSRRHPRETTALEHRCEPRARPIDSFGGRPLGRHGRVLAAAEVLVGSAAARPRPTGFPCSRSNGAISRPSIRATSSSLRPRCPACRRSAGNRSRRSICCTRSARKSACKDISSPAPRAAASPSRGERHDPLLDPVSLRPFAAIVGLGGLAS